jgi:hypothetical protein
MDRASGGLGGVVANDKDDGGSAKTPWVKSFVAAAVIAAGVVGLLAPTLHAASTTSPQKWASGVCSAVHSWIDASQAAIKNLKNATTLEEGAQQTSNAIDAATTELESSLQDLGKPSTSDGAKAKSALQKFSSQLESTSTSIKQELANPPTDAAGAAATFAQVGADLTTAGN